MRIVHAKLTAQLPIEVLRWSLFSALLHAASRLLYPIAIVLLSEARVGLALTSLLVPLGMSLLRAMSTNVAAGRVRRETFRRVGEVLEVLPRTPPASAPGVEQLEVRIARALPWLESRAVDTLPNLTGNFLALPLLAALAVHDLGIRSCLTVGVPMLVALLASQLFASRAARHYDAARDAFDGIAVMLERGLGARVELRAHGLSSSYQAALQEHARVWDLRERRARFAFALTGWGVPVAALVLAAVMAQLAGIDALGWVLRFFARPEAVDVRAGMYMLVALPLVLGIARNWSELAAEQPHLDALSAFYELAPAGVEPPLGPIAGEVGDLVFDDAEFMLGDFGAGPSVSVRASFVWRRGESLALVGPNGSGKTTLALAAIGAIHPTRGSCKVRVQGEFHAPSVLTGRVSYLSQHPYFGGTESVLEAVRFLAPDATCEAITSCLGRLWPEARDPAILERSLASLSSGERRLVALCRVLLRPSELLVLDEPEANLSRASRTRVEELLREVLRERRVLMLTHDPNFAALTSRVLELDELRELRPVGDSPVRVAEATRSGGDV